MHYVGRDELAHARWKSRRLLAVVSLSFGVGEKPTARRVFKGHFDTLMRMCGNLISHPTKQFSKLLFVRKILLHRTCEAYENSNTDIEELFSHL